MRKQKVPKKPCPKCGAHGKFIPRIRDVKDEVELYICCRYCPYENVLKQGPEPLVRLQMDVDELRAKVDAGAGNLQSVLEARQQRLDQMEAAR